MKDISPLVVSPLVQNLVVPPLVPHKCDLTSFPYLPIEVENFLSSREWISFDYGSGAIQPIKVGNRLKWKLKDIETLCNFHRGAK